MRKLFLAGLSIAVFVFVLGMSMDVHASDLAAYWPFDEGTGTSVADSSGNGNDGTTAGATQWVGGRMGGALQFDGDTAIVTVPHSESLDFGDDFSVVFWVQTTQAKADIAAWWNGGWIINKDMPGQADCTDWDIANVGGTIVFITGNAENDADDLLVSSPINDGEWRHIAITRERESGLKTIYIDGVEDVSEAHGPGLAVSNEIDMTIGGHPGGAAHAFEGILDDMAIYNRVLSQDEIVNSMQSGPSAVEPVSKLTITWGKIKS